MLPLNLKKDPSAELTVLCIGAHCDDIEIGCGGTLLHLKDDFPQLRFHWVVLQCVQDRAARRPQRLRNCLPLVMTKRIVLKDFRDGFLPYSGGKVKEFFEEIKGQVDPDLIFTHWRGDAHQDHRLISELTWNTFRDHLILRI